MRWSLPGCLLLLVGVPVAWAQSSQATLGERMHAFADQEVGQYRLAYKDDGTELKLVPKSLLRWSNATRNTAFGDTYIWTDKGCARAIVSIFALGPPRNSIAMEFQSLSNRSLHLYRGDELIWHPTSAGVSMQPVELTRPPVDSAVSRLVQMNGLARRFRGEFAPHTAPEEFTQLRLLPKPLYRYQSNDDTVVDGAVYGMVDATDPEMLLIIEAHQQDGRKSWHYSPARSRHDHLRLYLADQLVWDAPRLAPPWPNIRDPSKPYFNFRLDKLEDAAELRKVIEVFRGR